MLTWLGKGTWSPSQPCGAVMRLVVCGERHVVFSTRPQQQHSLASRCLPNANEVAFQFLGTEHSAPY